MSSQGEIHVGDLKSLYQVPIYDDDLEPVNLDPSSASVMKIRIRMPGNDALIERDATAAQVTIDGESVWCLTYEVDPNDAADVDEFHIAPGPIALEGYIEYSDGGKWTSNKITTDHQGRPLKVHPNL